MRYFMYAENADMHYMYSRKNYNGMAALRKYHGQFPDHRMPNRRIFQRLHRQLREICSPYFVRHDVGRRRVQA
ncbi:hypothetical protein TNCV_4139211 [Trichonephila clavipes]|nr:hypothetical protein TNCV_4139211 [Trichonephila clavipes]